MSKALVVLSGGQDSTTCAFLAAQKHEEVHCLTVNYGQRHAIEIDAAKKVAALIHAASHELCDVGPILTGKSFLTDHSAEVHGFNTYEEMNRKNAAKEDKLDSSFVPMRNVLFMTLAANRASVLECDTIYTGITAADFAEYGEFSWQWLGGFVDAEGHFSTINGDGYRLSVSQSDPEMLERLGKWIKKKCPDTTYSLYRRPKDGNAELYLGKRAVDAVMPLLSPHLHSPYRRDQAESKGIVVSPEMALTIEYVTGFWEGDGSCGGQEQILKKKYITYQFYFSFFQKDPAVLEKIQKFLDKGSLYQRNTQNRIWVLTVSDGPQSAKLLNRMRPHFNLLGSFAKVSKARNKFGFEAGGFNPPYPDCSPDFLAALQRSTDEALKSPFNMEIKIEAPLLYLTKAQSVWLAQNTPGALDALAYSHTCYAGKYAPCNKCHACLLRQYGFEVAGLPDPLVVRAYREGLMPLPTTSNYDRVSLEATL